ncbi:WD40-repeat-containing domain protein [Chytridium lagenaria]|nr:WD40-repeat-containing domain protein [Chytridium lagenaria]
MSSNGWGAPGVGATASTESSGSTRQIPLTCIGHTRPVVDLCFSSFTHTGDFFFVSACKDSIPILRKGSTGDWVGSFQGHKGAVWSAKLTRDAALSVTGSGDFTAKVWDNLSGTAVVTFDHSHVVRVVDVSDDGRYVLTAGMEKKVRVFDLQGNPQTTPIRTLEGNANGVKTALLDSVHGLVFNGDGKELRVWDLRESKQVNTRTFNSELTSLRFSWDRKYIICTEGKRVHFYDAVSAALVKSFDTKIDVSSASLHPNGTRFVVGGASDLWVRVHDFATGAETEVYKGHHGPIHCVSYSPDGLLYATGSEDGTVRLWQTYPGTAYGLW